MILKRILMLSFLVVFWSLISEASNNTINITDIISYFLIAQGVGELLMADNTNFGRTIRRAVKRGSINQVLIRPVELISYLYFTTLGERGVAMFWAIGSIIIGIIINKGITIYGIILFPLFFFSAFFIAFAYNLFEGAISFVFTEVSGIKNSLHHITRVLSGLVVPLTFFPEGLRNIVNLSPFPAMISAPTNALKLQDFTSETFNLLLISFFWAIFLNIVVTLFWKKALKKYEAIGI